MQNHHTEVNFFNEFELLFCWPCISV